MDKLSSVSGVSITVLDDILDSAIAITRADMGNIQLLDRKDNTLRIVVSRGFEPPFLDFFAVVGRFDHSACAFSLFTMQRTIINDINVSPFFVGKRSGEILREAMVRAVQSTPLVGGDGNLMGMISTHWRIPFTPSDDALRRLDSLIAQTIDQIGGVTWP